MTPGDADELYVDAALMPLLEACLRFHGARVARAAAEGGYTVDDLGNGRAASAADTRLREWNQAADRLARDLGDGLDAGDVIDLAKALNSAVAWGVQPVIDLLRERYDGERRGDEPE